MASANPSGGDESAAEPDWEKMSTEDGRPRGACEAQTGCKAEGAGEAVNPSATSSDGGAAQAGRLSRRIFLLSSMAAGAGMLVGCGGSDSFTPFSPTVDQTKAWQLSTRGVDSASNAAKAHAANKRFVSAAAADLNRAHPGDRSRIVQIDIKPATWQQWFGGGLDCVDLRQI